MARVKQTRGKKRVRKNIAKGVAHVHSTFNNTIVTSGHSCPSLMMSLIFPPISSFTFIKNIIRFVAEATNFSFLRLISLIKSKILSKASII